MSPDFLYIKTTMDIPGAPAVVHIAELEPLDGQLCRPLRMVELGAGEQVQGAYRRHPVALHNFATTPQDEIVHPDHWGELDGISASSMTAAEFETLWLEAEQKFQL
ncbi:hypothetical protein [Corynebacterium epidermidicanis]|uniref:Uncharacterized protein n=1 Tax=Corynebacterium epidermidicanis TaxID=1050174 RepID=A0A0G3GZS2_9CORY|nr:hypothetical protein [Corynebacterium epidermidicanis]AKK04342.1 hypothetical protein CEPID_12600 [Corynebacterium epidermidicanis]